MKFRSRSDLMDAGATCVAEASSQHDTHDPIAWTELSIWWLDTQDRPFIGVVEGRVAAHAPEDMTDRWRATSAGTLDAIVNWFDASNLREDLVEAIPADARDIYLDSNALSLQRTRAKRGYRGPDTLNDAVAWLYDNDELTPTQMAKAVERDFSIPWRTVYNGMQANGATGWGKGFIKALRFFDRGAWRQKKREQDGA